MNGGGSAVGTPCAGQVAWANHALTINIRPLEGEGQIEESRNWEEAVVDSVGAGTQTWEVQLLFAVPLALVEVLRCLIQTNPLARILSQISQRGAPAFIRIIKFMRVNYLYCTG